MLPFLQRQAPASAVITLPPFLDWTPDAATWKQFQDAPGDITVTVTTAPYATYSANGDRTRPADATTFRVAPAP